MKYYTTKQLQELLHCGHVAIYGYVKSGKLHGSKIGHQWLFEEEDVKQFISKYRV
jgi:excisionase family DNA binding protein